MSHSLSEPILVFDGDCGFCSTCARWAQCRLHLPRVEPWQSLDLSAFGLTEEACLRAVQFVSVEGSVSEAEFAVIAALRHAGGPWQVVARLLGLPVVRPLAGWVYRMVASNRHRLPGGTRACQVEPEISPK